MEVPWPEIVRVSAVVSTAVCGNVCFSYFQFPGSSTDSLGAVPVILPVGTSYDLPAEFPASVQ